MTFKNLKGYKLIIIAGGIFLSASVLAKGSDCLKDCWNKQVMTLSGQYLKLSYSEQFKELHHGFEPWASISYTGKGVIFINNDNFLKSDTVSENLKEGFKYSKTQMNNGVLLLQNYYESKIGSVSKNEQEDLIFKSARYSPVFLINYFYKKHILPDAEESKSYSIYSTKINNAVVKLYISSGSCLLEKMTTLQDDDLYGDVLTTYSYKRYVAQNKEHYPSLIYIEKFKGRLVDSVEVTGSSIVNPVNILEKPLDYKVREMEEVISPDPKVEKYCEHVYFVEFAEADSRIMLVEYSDFLLVAGAPFNSKNGEIILKEAKKIAPYKPVKYFVFGHHHPHYIGGLRAFIHNESTILAVNGNTDYVNYIAAAPHTLNPDLLTQDPKPLKLEEIVTKKSISDGHFEMQIYCIGKKSAHSNDYLIFYFPSLKLLFEEDLARIDKEGPIAKARPRQAGLYNAVKELGLKTDTIVQSWPIKEHNIKTVFSFKDLENSVNDVK